MRNAIDHQLSRRLREILPERGPKISEKEVYIDYYNYLEREYDRLISIWNFFSHLKNYLVYAQDETFLQKERTQNQQLLQQCTRQLLTPESELMCNLEKLYDPFFSGAFVQKNRSPSR